MVADGAYYSKENVQLASEKNIELVTTGLSGKDAKEILNEFTYNEELTRVLKCPAGYEPRSSCFVQTEKWIRSSFKKSQCESCLYKDQCKPKFLKRVAQVKIYRAGIERARLQKKIRSQEFRDYGNLRSGIETVPSNIRRNYNIEKLPRGKQRGKFFFGCKIAALNFRKLFIHRKGLGNYAPNPLLV